MDLRYHWEDHLCEEVSLVVENKEDHRIKVQDQVHLPDKFCELDVIQSPAPPLQRRWPIQGEASLPNCSLHPKPHTQPCPPHSIPEQGSKSCLVSSDSRDVDQVAKVEFGIRGLDIKSLIIMEEGSLQ